MLARGGLTFVLPFLYGLSAVLCRTIFLELNAPNEEEVSFLKKYGYIPESADIGEFAYTVETLSDAIMKMQAFAGLPQTGAVDPQTKKLFQMKRCGVKDVDVETQSRTRRYIIQQGWDKRTITYRVLNGSRGLARGRVEALMEAGLAVWAPHGGLTFTRVDTGHADITVFFASGEHGDGFPFDGEGHVVAHAFPPPHGAMHFDDDEQWGDSDLANPRLGEDDDVTDFFAVAVHEIGHALGLSHSDVRASVMYPYYQVPVETLHMDDILGMQELYLKNTDRESSPGTDVPQFTKTDSEELDTPDLCLTNYDTLQVIDGKIYVFEEEWVWVLKDRNVLEAGYPQRFHDVFRGLPAKVAVIRTVYQRFNGNVVIFQNRTFWEFAAAQVGYRLVHRGKITARYRLPPRVADLTTVFISNYNNKTYLIEDERFWRFDESARKMDPGYPKEMSAWRQVPYPVDAAIVWKGDTYFFRGPRFWRFDNWLVAAHEYYPLPVAQIWFGCDFHPDMNLYLVNDGP